MPDEKNKRSIRLSPGLAGVLLIAVIIAQLVYTIFCFETKKTGIFGDEVWGYGLSNSYYQPFVHLKDGVSINDAKGDDINNYFEWVDGSVFGDYTTVQRGERFSYGSVYYNQTLDCHPPLFYMLLHTVCSFFPDSFSLRYAFFLNCIFLIVTQIFFYKLGRLVTKSKWKALLICVLYAGGTGALSTFIYLRQYSLLTMLVVMHSYFAAKVYYDDASGLKKLLPAAVTAFLAFFTHYYGVVYIGALTAFMCLNYLCKKKIKTMFAYGGAMFASLVLFIALYPAVIGHVMQESFFDRHALAYFDQIRLLANYLLSMTVGISVSVYRSASYSYVIAVVVAIAGLIIPLCVLFRKEKWFGSLKAHIKDYFGGIIGALRKSGKNLFPLLTALTVIVSALVINWQVDFFYYAYLAQRYLFFLMPSVCLAVFCIVDAVMMLLIPILKKHSAKVMAVLCAAALVRINLVTDCKYYFAGLGSHDEVRDAFEGKNCVVIIKDIESINLLTSFSSYFGKAAHIYATASYYLAQTAEDILASEYADDIDYLLVTGGEYVLSSEQYDSLSRLADEKGYEEFEEIFFRVEGSDKDALQGFLGEQFENFDQEDTRYGDTRYMEFVNSFCPRENYTPRYLLDINGFNYIVLERVKS